MLILFAMSSISEITSSVLVIWDNSGFGLRLTFLFSSLRKLSMVSLSSDTSLMKNTSSNSPQKKFNFFLFSIEVYVTIYLYRII